MSGDRFPFDQPKPRKANPVTDKPKTDTPRRTTRPVIDAVNKMARVLEALTPADQQLAIRMIGEIYAKADASEGQP